MSRNFVATQVASEITSCNMPRNHKVTQHFCCKEYYKKYNPVLLFATIAATLRRMVQCNIPRNISVKQPIKSRYLKIVPSPYSTSKQCRNKLQETLHSVAQCNILNMQLQFIR